VSEDDYGFVERVPDAGIVRKRNSAFLRVIGGYLGLALILGLIAFGALGWGWTIFTSAGPLKENKIVDLKAGSGRNEIAQKLAEEGVISNPRVMSVAALAAAVRGSTVRPGEYQFPARAPMSEVLDIILSGRVLTYKLTIPEGWTSEMAVARINDNDVLTGDAVTPPAEGTLIADTQVFRRGMTRAKILQDMQEAQSKLVDDIWAKHSSDSPLKSKEQMVTLASIVEKETAKAAERPKIAAVFLNRLKKGMRLQSDPTIIYGLTGGKSKLDRALTRSDIDSNTAYNTYQIDGLPPGPIATPGVASLEAVVTPDATEALYFVADGTGGHAFATTLEDHNANVKKWREVVKSGILLPEGNNGTVSPDHNKIAPEVQQPALPAGDDVTAGDAVDAPAVADAAVAEATATKGQTQGVPAPKEGDAVQGSEAKPVAVEPPPLPVEKKTAVAAAESDANVPAVESPSAGVPATDIAGVLKPGTVVKVGTQLVPIPRFKPPKP
jgi:UPF0755 protein